MLCHSLCQPFHLVVKSLNVATHSFKDSLLHPVLFIEEILLRLALVIKDIIKLRMVEAGSLLDIQGARMS